MAGIELTGHVSDPQVGRQPLLIMAPEVRPRQLMRRLTFDVERESARPHP